MTGRINNLVGSLNVLREIYGDMTLNHAVVLSLVAANPGISQREIMDQTGLTDGSTSRIVALLSEYGNRGTGPFHLIEMRPDPNDRRYKTLHLTQKGRGLFTKITNILAKGE